MSIFLYGLIEYLLPNGASPEQWCKSAGESHVRFSSGVQSFSTGSLSLGQSKLLYSILAGIGSQEPKIAPRGLPMLVSDAVRNELFLPITRDDETMTDSEVGEATARKFVASGRAFYGSSAKVNPRHSIKFVSRADAFSIGWLRIGELRRIFADAKLEAWDVSPGIALSVAAMQYLENKVGQDQVRLIFWFRN